MNPLRRILRRLVLTADERTLLEAQTETVLRALAGEEPYRVLRAILDAAPTPGEPPTINRHDAEAWQAALATPTGRKVDAAMTAWLQQQMLLAISQPTAEVVGAAKYALGCRAGWEMGKSISRLAAAHSSDIETPGATTAAPGLAHLQP